MSSQSIYIKISSRLFYTYNEWEVAITGSAVRQLKTPTEVESHHRDYISLVTEVMKKSCAE